MLLVKTRIGMSPIAGIGLFADEFIAKETHIWRFRSGFDIRVPETYMTSLSGPVKIFFQTYAYQNPDTKNYVLCSDNARFFNHSDTPNTHCVVDPDDEETMDVASQDILIGEELTVDYRTFDTDPAHGFSS